MCTLLPESACKSIAAPMRKIIKHAGKLSNSLPPTFLNNNHGLNMTDLFQCITQNHIFTFTNRFNNSQILSGIYYHRLHNLQNALWITVHPFSISDFSVWKFTKTFKLDLLCRTLHFASLINISFDYSNLPLPEVP